MNRLPRPVLAWLEGQGRGEVTRIQPVGGGCINHGARLWTSSGDSYFLKTNPSLPADVFSREAEGLAILRRAGGPRFPEPYLWGPDFLLMEDLAPASPQHRYWEALGRSLTTLHRATAPRFGFDHDNYLGSTPQPNPWTADGFEFFGQHRLVYQARLAQRNGLLDAGQVSRVERLAGRLGELIPPQPASLIHGDLWAGNVIADGGGAPALIDPAAHYGWAEAELGMTALFGGFPPAFYESYEEARPLEPGWRGRLPLYNLYHLLNHVNLFGGMYLGQALAVLGRFA